MNTNHLTTIKARIQSTPLSQPPSPWRKIGALAVGGLRSIGFDTDSELVLVVSNAGRGVINCESMEKVSRDCEEYYGSERFLEAKGIGPLLGRTIRVSGVFGGGLINTTHDGWSIESAFIDWPIQEVLLLEPFHTIYGERYGKPGIFHKIFRDFEVLAAGFSYSGRSLIVATSSDITVWGR